MGVSSLTPVFTWDTINTRFFTLLLLLRFVNGCSWILISLSSWIRISLTLCCSLNIFLKVMHFPRYAPTSDGKDNSLRPSDLLGLGNCSTYDKWTTKYLTNFSKRMVAFFASDRNGGRPRNCLGSFLLKRELFELNVLAPLPFPKAAMMGLFLGAGLATRLEWFTAVDFGVLLVNSLMHPSTSGRMEKIGSQEKQEKHGIHLTYHEDRHQRWLLRPLGCSNLWPSMKPSHLEIQVYSRMLSGLV